VAEILVEFVPDFTKLENGVDKLVNDNTISKEMAALFNDAGKSLDAFGAKFAKLGGGNTLKPAIDAAKKSIKDLSTSGIKDLGELKKRVDGITNSFTEGLGEGVKQALDEAGISLEEFQNLLKKTEETNTTLKSSLRDITEQLAQMKIRGEENTVQYQELAAKAGLYRDALGDVQKEINKTASDTRKLDTAIEFIQGIAGAFAIMQGVIALAGDESEEFQKTLLKVNAAMSILAGLQQLQNLLQKESNIIRAVSLVQQRAGIVATNLETAAQSKNVVIKGAAIVTQRILNAVMAANPALIVVAALGALAAALVLFTGKTRDAADVTAELNRELEKSADFANESLDIIDRRTKIEVEKAKQRGDSELQVQKIISDGLKTQAKELEFFANEAAATAKGLSTTVFTQTEGQLNLTSRLFNSVAAAAENLNNIKDFKVTQAFKDLSKSAKESVNQLELATSSALKFQQQISEFNDKVELTGLENQSAAAEKAREAAKKAAEEAKKRAEDAAKAQAELIQRGFEDQVAKEKLKLLQVEKGGQDELKVRQGILKAELQLALNNDKLTFNQRKLLIKQFFADQKELSKQLQENNKKQALEDQASLISAQLAALNLSFDERERLTIEQLEIERQIQLAAVVNNKSKEKEINAKFDKEIIEQRKTIRQAAFAEELADLQRDQVIKKALLQNTASDENLDISERAKALSELSRIELDAITRRRLFNQSQLKAGLIDIEEYNRNAKDIANDEFTTKAALEKQYTDIVQSESDKRLTHLKETIGAIAEFASSAIDSLRGFMETIAANEDNRIAAQKDSLERLRQNGIVSQKEYEARLKVIDRLDRQNKQRQAEREKAMALFQALVNGAAAIVEAAPDPFKIVATSILVAAQIAAIVARQVPKFGKGTKSAPKGFAEVGETGTELIQMNGKYFVADHPQVIWMKGGERVYNPNETKDILTPQANMTVINNSNGHSKDLQIDYDKMAKKFGDEIAKHPRSLTNFDAEGVSHFLIEGLNKSKYLNNRFRF
jgi:hypothetical protein